MGERWNEKLAAFRRRLAEFGRANPPRMVTPKRASGPVRVPSDDWLGERGRHGFRLCQVCRAEVIEGLESRMGRDMTCASCKRESGPYAAPDLPEPPRAA